LATHWNKSQAASKLHWSRMTLYRKMQKFEIHGSRQ
jgi:transcriptional regulator of acetoin/glycerol metabolism